MNYFAVIDTNVIVSALLKDGSIPSQILDLVVEGRIIPVYNDEIIQEYEDVLTRNKFGFSSSKVKMVLSLIIDVGEKVEPVDIYEKFIDKDDIKFYQVVMSVKRYDDGYLVTGNKKHFPINDFVVSAIEMINIVKGN